MFDPHKEKRLAQTRAAMNELAPPLKLHPSALLRRKQPNSEPASPPLAAPIFTPLEEVQQPPKPSSPKRKASPTVVLEHGGNLHPQPVRWLWRYWLALGKLHILAGAPGQGKTTIALSLAAAITTGGNWPDGQAAPQGNVLIWSGEDDPADTLLPRLLASGADRKRCHFIKGTQEADGTPRPFDPATDLPGLHQAIEQIGGIRLLIIDPVVSAVTGDSHKNTEVRRALQPVVDLAAAVDCAVIGITHFSKGGQGTDPAQRVNGSIAFTAVARVVLVAAKVKGEEGEDSRIFARSKSNIGPDDGGFTYRIDMAEIRGYPGLEASRITWGSPVQGSARELLTDPSEGAEEAGQSSKDLPMMLWAELREGVAPSKQVEAALKACGYSAPQIRRAREKMGIRPEKGGMKDSWYWSLPAGFVPRPEWLECVKAAENSPEDDKKRPEDAEDAGAQTLTSSASSQHLRQKQHLREAPAQEAQNLPTPTPNHASQTPHTNAPESAPISPENTEEI